MSGTCSERSGGSLRELTYVKSLQEHQAMGQDSRVMFVSKNGRIPFAVTSILLYKYARHAFTVIITRAVVIDLGKRPKQLRN